MCCGKDDNLKQQISNISHLICTDFAEVSVNQAEERYNEIKNRPRFFLTVEFIAWDAKHANQCDFYLDPNVQIDLTSYEFVFHFCFEYLPQVEQMLHNAANCLKPSDFFNGAMPDANEFLRRQRKANDTKFGNSIFELKLQFEPNCPPLFGAKYDFHIEEVVDCSEFLVHFPTFVKLAARYNQGERQSFGDYYHKMI